MLSCAADDHDASDEYINVLYTLYLNHLVVIHSEHTIIRLGSADRD